MRTSRNVKIDPDEIFWHRKKKTEQKTTMYSGFFSSLTDNVMCSNYMYDCLMKEIESTVSVYSVKDKLSITVYESSKATDLSVHESVLVGFRKYVGELKRRAKSRLQAHFMSFSGIFLVGVLMEYLLYGAFPDCLPVWITSILDIIAWVFVWQFAAYIAFEFVKEKREIKRLEQINNIKFTFRHWE